MSSRTSIRVLRGIPLKIATCVLCACGSDGVPVADRVFVNGGVYTVDEQRSWAEAVAIRDGAIVFVGKNDEVGAYIGESTLLTDLSGKMLLPGFHDAHAHILNGGRSLNSCNLHNTEDLQQIRDLLIGCRDTRNYGPDEWVVGAQWPISAFGPEGPSRQILDEIFGDRPAVFVDSFVHNSWVSTRALELAGIDADTPNPPGGIIVRDPVSGMATGTLRESAMALVADIVPPATAGENAADLAAGLAEAARFGITAYIEPGIRASELDPYLFADRDGKLSARVLASLSPIGLTIGAFGSEVYDLVLNRHSLTGKYVKADSVKVFMDGVIETKTANMLEPYSDDRGNADSFYDQAAANELYQRLDRMGVQIHTHAIGDGAVRKALNAYEYALQQNGPNDNRHHIVHLQLVDSADIPRFSRLNVAANFQALWAYPDQYIHLAISIVGQARVDRFYAIRSIVDTGATLAGGSDWPVSSLNPLDAIEVAVRRQDPAGTDGQILRASERVDLTTILDAYTRHGAWLMRLDDKTGSIESGKRADLIVLDRNLFDIAPEDINEARVLMTLMDGREVFSAE